MKRRDFIKTMGSGVVAISTTGALSTCKPKQRPPNIIYILADDLGYRELGCYGQKKIRTPNIDRLAVEGIKFTQHYSGSPVCAPSRCTLLTGKHTGHAFIRDNDEMSEMGDVWNDPSLEGQRPLLSDSSTIGSLLQTGGYATAAIGKWGLGGPDTTGTPNKQGFDFWFGYLCQRQAHNYYPTHLWRNTEKYILEGNPAFKAHQKFPEDRDPKDRTHYLRYAGKQYAPDLMTEESLEFIRKNQNHPFFLYLAYPIPHLALQVPEDSLAEYAEAFPEMPYLGDKGYLPHPKPRAAYAAMITRMDRDIGRILSLLTELGLAEDTLVIFSSDNGPTFTGGSDSQFFQSAGELRGLKGSLYEGGIRVPMLARWPGHIAAGTYSSHISAFWDVLPTLCEIAGVPIPGETDGISFAPTLLSQGTQQQHEYLYWEFPGYGGQQAVLWQNWKAIRTGLKREDSDTAIQLYNLENDVGESQNVAEKYPDQVARAQELILNVRVESERFPFPEIHTRPIK